MILFSCMLKSLMDVGGMVSTYRSGWPDRSRYRRRLLSQALPEPSAANSLYWQWSQEQISPVSLTTPSLPSKELQAGTLFPSGASA